MRKWVVAASAAGAASFALGACTGELRDGTAPGEAESPAASVAPGDEVWAKSRFEWIAALAGQVGGDGKPKGKVVTGGALGGSVASIGSVIGGSSPPGVAITPGETVADACEVTTCFDIDATADLRFVAVHANLCVEVEPKAVLYRVDEWGALHPVATDPVYWGSGAACPGVHPDALKWEGLEGDHYLVCVTYYGTNPGDVLVWAKSGTTCKSGSILGSCGPCGEGSSGEGGGDQGGAGGKGGAGGDGGAGGEGGKGGHGGEGGEGGEGGDGGCRDREDRCDGGEGCDRDRDGGADPF